MKTQIPGIKACEMIVSKTCRETHNNHEALIIAIHKLKDSYWETIGLKVNEDATLRFVLTIDRD